jgi:hypothetical protein
MEYHGSMLIFYSMHFPTGQNHLATDPRSVLTAIRGLQAAGSETCGEAVGRECWKALKTVHSFTSVKMIIGQYV